MPGDGGCHEVGEQVGGAGERRNPSAANAPAFVWSNAGAPVSLNASSATMRTPAAATDAARFSISSRLPPSYRSLISTSTVSLGRLTSDSQ
jgi:hypothetical protein